jgi:HEAT repeat protein
MLTSSAACPLPLALTSSEVCVPDRFLVELDAEEQRGALAHEVAHLARRDPAWLLFAMAIEAVMFFQPLNRLARRRLKESAEYLCDEWAAREGAGLGLARCLARVAVWLRPGAEPLLASTSAIADGRSGLVRRVERLLAGQAKARRGRAAVGFGMATAMMLVVTGAAPAVSVMRPVLSERPTVSDVRASRAMQEVIVRAPRMEDAIGQRWAWAVAEARSRGYRRFWVVYAFDRPVGAQQQYLSDSDGVNIDEFTFRGTPLRSVLGVDPAERGTIAVLFHFGSASGDEAIDRIGHRSMTIPMNFGGDPVLWLGSAADVESVPWLDGVRARMQLPKLQVEVVEAIGLHPTSALVLPVLDRLLTSEGSEVVRAEAAEGLEYHDTSESMRLAERTARNDASQTVRQEAAEALGEIHVAGSTDVLVELALGAPGHGVRMEAAEALGAHPSSRALPALERVIFGSTIGALVGDVSVGAEAVEAVGEVEGGARLELLRRVIWEHPTVELRREAVETLEDVESADVLGVLEDVLRRHPDGAVRNEAVDVLSSLDSPSSRRILLETVRSGQSADMRREAIETLAGDKKDTRTAAEVEELARLLERVIFEDADRDVRLEALEAVEELPREVARALLRKVVESHPDAGMRREAVDMLGSMR